MTGQVIGRIRPSHRCQPPCIGLDNPSEPLGTAWRCGDCRKVWLVVEPPQVRAGQQRVAPVWRPATLRERLRLTP